MKEAGGGAVLPGASAIRQNRKGHVHNQPFLRLCWSFGQHYEVRLH